MSESPASTTVQVRPANSAGAGLHPNLAFAGDRIFALLPGGICRADRLWRTGVEGYCLSRYRSFDPMSGTYGGGMAGGTVAGCPPLLSWRVPAEMNAGALVVGSLASKEDHPGELKSLASLREEMVERDIAARGVRDELVLGAMHKVPRELFLPKNLREFAYEDWPLPIAGEQTISQPFIVAFMAESLLLKGGEKILEIGAGSGYAAAVLSEIAAQVYTVERLGQLAEKAAATLADLGYDNVRVLHGDGTHGWLEHAPYDAIVVAAGGPQVPESLKAQLKIGGRLVIPVGADQRVQELVRVTRVSENEYRSEDIADVCFVPLIGEEGWTTAKEGEARHVGAGRCGRFLRKRKRWSGPRRRSRIVSVE